MTIRILLGEVREKLRELPDNSVHCAVTSPPYWGLRSYLPDGHPDKAKEIGCEPTLGEHLDVMVNEVFAEVWRVLRPDGTCWVNYGDCYATSPNGRRADEVKRLKTDDRTFRDKPFSTVGPIYVPDYEKTSRVGTSGNGGNLAGAHGGRVVAGGTLKPKDLCMVPNRFAIAMQDFGWWVRSEVIWHKPNPMPESISDRPATSHEKMFLFTKSERYFYDAVAVRTDAKGRGAYKMPDGWNTEPGAHGSFHPNGREKGAKTEKQRGHGRRHAGFNDLWDQMPVEEQMAGGANLRNVWTIATKPFKEAHFATFPPGLVRPCIMAGTSEKGCCPNCGAQWRRVTTKSFTPQPGVSIESAVRREDQHDETCRWKGSQRGSVSHQTVAWEPSCSCSRQSPVPAIVLDPFGGAGTTGLVAAELNRSAVLIELNPDSVNIARNRIEPALRQGSLLSGFNSLEVA